MQLFGKEIQLRSHECSANGLPGGALSPHVNLYIKITNACNASCPFCSNQNCTDPTDFDIDKFFIVLDEICRSGIRLNRINFTGGEPSVKSELVKTLLDRISLDLQLDKTQVQINTNLLTEEAHKLVRHPRLDVVSVSRHHPKGFLGKSDAQNLSGLPLGKSNLSCVLVKGLNDDIPSIQGMLDCAVSNGIPHVGFVELMPMNEYAKTHHLALSDIDWESIPGLRKVMEHRNGNVCHCSNYVYCAGGRMVDAYMRNYSCPDYCESSLLFDGQYLRQGFQSDNIIF